MTTVERDEGLLGRVGGAVEDVEVGMALFGVDKMLEDAGPFRQQGQHNFHNTDNPIESRMEQDIYPEHDGLPRLFAFSQGFGGDTAAAISVCMFFSSTNPGACFPLALVLSLSWKCCCLPLCIGGWHRGRRM